tara:strand:- start:6866 stop:7204 length:339 start_codon:yes stop_codon:yes gene_type:complete
MFGVERKVAAVARKAALFSASALLATVGVAFLTGAAWLLLVELRSPLFAATVIGSVYVGLALVGLGIASSSSDRTVVPHDRTHDLNGLSPLQLVVVSFLQGIEQGARSKREV